MAPLFPALEADMERPVRDAVERSAAPLSVSDLRKATGMTSKRVKQIVENILRGGRLHAFPGRSLRVWHSDPMAWARQTAIDIARSSAKPRTQLSSAIRKRVKGLAKPQSDEIVTALIAGGELVEYPGPLRPAARLLVARSANGVYLAAAMQQLAPILERLASAGLTRDQIADAVRGEQPQAAAGDRIMEALRDVEPEAGLEVWAGRVRHHPLVAGLSKQVFDEAAVRLATDGDVLLSRHDDPYNLPAADREELILSPPDTYYVAFARRA